MHFSRLVLNFFYIWHDEMWQLLFSQPSSKAKVVFLHLAEPDFLGWNLSIPFWSYESSRTCVWWLNIIFKGRSPWGIKCWTRDHKMREMYYLIALHITNNVTFQNPYNSMYVLIWEEYLILLIYHMNLVNDLNNSLPYLSINDLYELFIIS